MYFNCKHFYNLVTTTNAHKQKWIQPAIHMLSSPTLLDTFLNFQVQITLLCVVKKNIPQSTLQFPSYVIVFMYK